MFPNAILHCQLHIIQYSTDQVRINSLTALPRSYENKQAQTISTGYDVIIVTDYKGPDQRRGSPSLLTNGCYFFFVMWAKLPHSESEGLKFLECRD
jgi:hypothetical protein